MLRQALLFGFINWLPAGVLFCFFVAAGIVYYRAPFAGRRKALFLRMAIAIGVLRLLFAGIKTAAQYVIWKQDPIAQFLLPPHTRIGVLLHYVWTHYWLNAFISIGAALLLFGVFRLLASHNERFFNEGEFELGFLMALIVGWPQFVIFVPAVFCLVVLMSVVRGLWFNEPYTTLGIPLFLAAIVAVIAYPYVVHLKNFYTLVI